MSLGCARCGNCCDPVHLAPDQAAKIDVVVELMTDVYSPGCTLNPQDERAWMIEHWHEIRRDDDGGVAYRCDQFDPETRACTAHNDRPPVCRNYPFYDRPGDPRELGRPNADGPSCSFWLDVPPAERPAGVRPLIPIEPVR